MNGLERKGEGLERTVTRDEWDHRLADLSNDESQTDNDGHKFRDHYMRHGIAGTTLVTEDTVRDEIQLGEKLGAGKYAAVYLAKNRKTGAELAVKVFSKDKRTKKQVYEIIREANFLRQLTHPPPAGLGSHPNITCMEDILETRSRLLLCMEYVNGKQLYDEVTAPPSRGRHMRAHPWLESAACRSAAGSTFRRSLQPKSFSSFAPHSRIATRTT